MSALVEMFRDAAAPGGRNRFSCPLQTWELLWELGRAFGWTRKGPTYVLPAKSPLEPRGRRNYEPGSVHDPRHVEADDAMAWARGLAVARGSPHRPAMSGARSAALADAGKLGSQVLPGVIDEFIAFAYAGA